MASAAAHRHRGAPVARRARRSRGGSGVRWDRVGRLALGVVLVVVLYLYISAGVALWGTWNASQADSARVAALERQHRSLKRQDALLSTGSVREAEARKLGFARPGEKVFLVRGLPPH